MRNRLQQVAFWLIVTLSIFNLGVIHALYLQGRFDR
jgi:hypothetical protein